MPAHMRPLFDGARSLYHNFLRSSPGDDVLQEVQKFWTNTAASQHRDDLNYPLAMLYYMSQVRHIFQTCAPKDKTKHRALQYQGWLEVHLGLLVCPVIILKQVFVRVDWLQWRLWLFCTPSSNCQAVQHVTWRLPVLSAARRIPNKGNVQRHCPLRQGICAG